MYYSKETVYRDLVICLVILPLVIWLTGWTGSEVFGQEGEPEAVLYFTPVVSDSVVGEQIELRVMVSSRVEVNAFSGTIEFSDSALATVGAIETNDSIIEFWVSGDDRPEVKANGDIYFEGAVTNSSHIGEGELFRLVLLAEEAEELILSFAEDSSVHKSDGLGTPVELGLEIGQYNITAQPQLPTPDNLQNSQVETDSFIADWDPVSEAEWYRVDISTDSFVNYQSATTTETGWMFSDLSSDTGYDWRVRAEAAGFQASQFAVWSVQTLTPEPVNDDPPEPANDDPTDPGPTPGPVDQTEPDPDDPPGLAVETKEAEQSNETDAILHGKVDDLELLDQGEVYFKWRSSIEDDWQVTPPLQVDADGRFSYQLGGLDPELEYEFQAALGWNGQELAGEVRIIDLRRPAVDESDLDPKEPVVAPFTGGTDSVQRLLVDPIGQTISRLITTGGVVSTGLAMLVLTSGSLASLPLRLGFSFLWLFGFKKRHEPWGIVYDSVSKRPLDPAYVVLYDLTKPDDPVETSITDLDGRYGFLTEPGQYRIEVNKTNYKFPSSRLQGRTADSLYNELYFGGSIEIERSGQFIGRDIPMDPDGFDWNEYAKNKQNILRFHNRYDHIIYWVAEVIFWLGLTFSVLAFLLTPFLYNYLIFVLYMVILGLRFLGLRPKPQGTVTSAGSGEPLAFAMVKVYHAAGSSKDPVKTCVCDEAGRYYCLIAPGRYYLTVEKRVGDEEYQEAYRSSVMEVKNGLIKERLRV